MDLIEAGTVAAFSLDGNPVPGALALLATAVLAWVILRRAWVSLETARAAAWTPFVSRVLSRWVGRNDYSEDGLLAADGVDEEWIARRRAGLERIAADFRRDHPRSLEWSRTLREGFSDLRFADANRVPFPFQRAMRDRFDLATVVDASDGPRLRDLDGQWSLDVSGSYGVNLAGFERYKEWIGAAWERVRDLGPVLGPLHPVVTENIAILKSLSGLDEVSFHASGTEAVMAAVRMARFNTRRKLVVTFSGAYHGWWDGVQPGLGNERDLGDCLPLRDLDPRSLRVIALRAHEIAAVLVNPVQAFHPNQPPPNDAVLVTTEVRKTEAQTSPYADWLRSLREVGTRHGVPLVFDEVFSGFRVAPGGAQQRFGVRADMVAYGKTIAGGLPIGVVCGKRDLMCRYDPDRPMRLAYVIGTFSAHPLVMAGMNEFLRWLTASSTPALYEAAEARAAAWVAATNHDLETAALPVRVMHFTTIWTVLFSEPGRHAWLFQYYLRGQGVTLSWVGTGRCMASLDFEPGDYDDLRSKIVAAATRMKADGWWPAANEQPERAGRMRWNLVKELAGSVIRVPEPLADFYAEIMQRKHDDHVASHSHVVNQLGHLFSSSAFLVCYVLAFFNLTAAMALGLSSLFVRQLGHAVIEPPCHDEEMKLLGFTTRSKTIVVLGYLSIPLLRWLFGHGPGGFFDTVAHDWFAYTVAVIVGHILLVAWQFDLRSAFVWFVKLATDPLTDIFAYASSPSRILRQLAERRGAA